MILADAFRRVLKFCPRVTKVNAGDPTLLSAVRLEPAREGRKARAYALSGAMGIAVDVDGEGPFPDVVLDATVLRSALKGKSQIASIQELPNGVVALDVESAKQIVSYKIPGGMISTFPFFPDPAPGTIFMPLPGFEYAIDPIARHASADDSRPELTVLAFGPGYVDATDLSRYARLITSWEFFTGHVPLPVFQAWPAGDVEAAWLPPYLYFRVAGELRFGTPREPGRFHDKMAAYLRDELPGAVVVAAADLRDLAERSAKISPWGVIVLELSPTGCVARSYLPERQRAGEASCEAEIPAVHDYGCALRSPVFVTVAARFLAAAVASTPTPRVRISYRDAVSPLRLDAGALSVLLWPSPWDELPT